MANRSYFHVKYSHFLTKLTDKEPKIYIPQTVFIKAGRINAWYFTNKKGKVSRKSRVNQTIENVRRTFLKRNKQGMPLVATHISLKKSGNNKYTTQFEFLTYQ